jgi:hypothetical protein
MFFFEKITDLLGMQCPLCLLTKTWNGKKRILMTCMLCYFTKWTLQGQINQYFCQTYVINIGTEDMVMVPREYQNMYVV